MMPCGKLYASAAPSSAIARELGRRLPMPADDAAGHSGIAEVIDTAGGPIALAGGVDERQVARRAGREEAPLERGGDRLGVPGADEAGATQRSSRVGSGPRPQRA